MPAVLFVSAASAEIRYSNFANPNDLSLAGDAAISGQALRLTTLKIDQSGAAWFKEKQHISSGFETTFRFQLTEQGGFGPWKGSDGFALVLQNAGPQALGGHGSAGGFALMSSNDRDKELKIPWSLAVFFDTHRNRMEHDPSDNYISYRSYGKPEAARWPAPRLAFTRKLSVRLKDGNVHTARILYQPPILSVFLDGSPTPVLKSTVDLSVVTDRQGSAWVGFTASTGTGYQNHDILNWSFTGASASSTASIVSSNITFMMSACLPGHNLSTPEKALVEPKGSGYHVILPGNLKWGASVANQPGRNFTVGDARGIICWDVKAPSSSGCSGPAGRGLSAGRNFLIPDAPLGALVMKTQEGRTWLSVNGRSDVSFKENEGFYEFDLESQ